MSEESVGKKLTLVDHLGELRKRLVLVATLHLLVALVCYQYVDYLMIYILQLNPGMELIYITPSELFMVYVKLSAIGAVVLCSPITIYEICAFVSKGLYKREKFVLIFSLTFGLLFFVGGAVFCYMVVLPITLNFFLRITISAVVPMISIASYSNFINTMLFAFGFVFEMPVVVFVLAKMNFIKPHVLIKKQPMIILIIFIVAAIITPPDVVSQILLAIPMVGLLQISIGVCWLVDRGNRKKERKQELAAAK